MFTASKILLDPMAENLRFILEQQNWSKQFDHKCMLIMKIYLAEIPWLYHYVIYMYTMVRLTSTRCDTEFPLLITISKSLRIAMNVGRMHFIKFSFSVLYIIIIPIELNENILNLYQNNNARLYNRPRFIGCDVISCCELQ